MLCKHPFIKGDTAFPCGQCLTCRINRRRLWTHRIILEALKHEFSCFVTLTYNDENYPKDGSLVPKHLQNYLKRLREAIKPHKIRFYAVGEYGDISGRAHYHLALFGMPESSRDLIQQHWPYGFTYTGGLSIESAQYIAGYVTKKMTKKDDPRLQGRHPEFARMSLRPYGIGAGALDEIEDFLYTDIGNKLLGQTKDVPLFLTHGGKNLPLGRYLRSKLRERLQIPNQGAASPAALKLQEELSAMLETSQTRSRWGKLAAYQKATKQKILNAETRHKIFSSKGKKI
ncbi:replication initiator protein [Apis mellifera associated microvirus 54]|nr:replication initiator protein [Apis mellifera associated microvirus 54]